ncbi:MAG: hypothetical protein QNJ89_03520 [Acidimicrobiia bacterium]|nr:hypothetical protein [Acidimicrobiia bacterium]
MFTRIRWFILGAATATGVLGYLASQLRKARERLTPRNLTNSGLRGFARALDSAADAVQPTRQKTQ